ncbi:MAG: glycosyltransferase family 2 protein, partial [Planctomycetota bacterium]
MSDATSDSHAAGVPPRVSVPMVAYRHDKWIGQAIESVLAQDMDDWEIVVADDLSDDATIEVASRYAREDERIRILPHGEKFGPRQNYMRAMRACRGEFISQLDGDDFFVDRSKLSSQARFLDEHPECSGVFGSWLETDGDGENGVLTEGFGLEGRVRFHPVDFGPNCVAASVSVMFRRGLFGEYPDWYTDVDVGDWPLHLLNTIHGGPYAYVPDVVSAHRNHSDGIWSKRTSADQAASTLRTHELFLRVLPKDLVITRAQRPAPAARVRLDHLRQHRGPEILREHAQEQLVGAEGAGGLVGAGALAPDSVG